MIIAMETIDRQHMAITMSAITTVYGHYTGKPVLPALPVKDWRLLLEQFYFLHALANSN